MTFGRLVAGVVKVSPRTFFRLSAFLGLVGLGLLMTNNPQLALLGVVLGGLGFANIWPMLFSITVEEMPERGSELSGLMCMAISGGALVPLLMAGTLDNFTNQFVPNAAITQAGSGATGTVANWDKATKTLAIKSLTGTFDGTNIISQSGSTSASARTTGLAGWMVDLQAGQFVTNSVITQAGSGAVGKVQAWDAATKTLIIETQTNVFNGTGIISQSTPSEASATPVTPVYSVVAANAGFSFMVPGACFAYLLLLSLKGSKKAA